MLQMLQKYQKKKKKKNKLFSIGKKVFAGLTSVHNIISLSCHEQICLLRLHFEGYFLNDRKPNDNLPKNECKSSKRLLSDTSI